MSYKLAQFSRWFLAIAVIGSLAVFGFGRAGAQISDGGALGDRYILTFQNIAATPEAWSVLISCPPGSATVEELMGAAVQLDFDSFQIEPLEFGAYIQAIVSLVGCDPNDFRIAIYNEDGEEIYTASVEEGTVELLPELADEFRAGIGLGGYSAEDFADFNLDDVIDIEDEGFVRGAFRQGVEAVQDLLGISSGLQQQEGSSAAPRPIAPGSSAFVSPTGQVSYKPGATDAVGRPVTSLTPGVGAGGFGVGSGGTTGGFGFSASQSAGARGQTGGGVSGTVGFGGQGGSTSGFYGGGGVTGSFGGSRGSSGGGVAGAPGYGGQGGSTGGFSTPFSASGGMRNTGYGPNPYGITP